MDELKNVPTMVWNPQDPQGSMKELADLMNSFPPVETRMEQAGRGVVEACWCKWEVLGYIAEIAIRLSETALPPGLKEVLEHVDAHWPFQSLGPDTLVFQASQVKVLKAMRFLLFGFPAFDAWNEAKTPGLRTWIDLEAFMQNLACCLRDRIGHDEEFDRKFAERHPDSALGKSLQVKRV